MPEIAFHTNAAEEMRAAAAYYEARERGLGDQFLDEIEEGLQRVQRFPFGLIYRIDPEKIFIIAVAHLHRRLGYWKSRE